MSLSLEGNKKNDGEQLLCTSFRQFRRREIEDLLIKLRERERERRKTLFTFM